MADILVRCTPEERSRIKAKAEATRLSMSSYLLKKGLNDDRTRDIEDSTTLSNLYDQLRELNQNLKEMSGSEFQREAIALCQQVGKEVVLYRLSRRVEQSL